MMSIANVRVLCAGVLLVMLAGCQSSPPELVGPESYPPDFQMVFTVMPQLYASDDDPLRYPAQHVVEADRTLRVALGPGAQHHPYPPPTATLMHAEMAELYRIAERAGLLDAERTDMLVPGDDEPVVLYRISVTADGETYDWLTSPEDAPGATDLLRRLVAISGR